MQENNNNYEEINVKEISSLKQPTIYFFLKSNNFSESYIKSLRNTENAILLNNKPADMKFRIEIEDNIKILKNPKSKTEIELCEGKLDIIYEDEDFLIVNKPHNLACMPSKSHFHENLGGQICNYMSKKDKNFVLRIINRLDKETAGLVIVAKSLFAYKSLSKINKDYHAICLGELEDDYLKIDSPILTTQTNGINDMKRAISPYGKPAVTHVQVLKKLKNKTLVKLNLETGRTHQIRVHMASIKHPLLEDSLYAFENEKPIFNTQKHCFLTLKKISFFHFRKNEMIELEIPYPTDWLEILNI